jgi:hypothetical protein
MPSQKVIARILLVCAVLFAQQTALAHDFWHASAAQKGAPAKGDKLCDLHDLLGTVLGVATGPATAHEPVFLAQRVSHSVGAAWADSRPLAAQSRGPPTIS